MFVRALSNLCRGQGKELQGATEGILCIKQAWPSTIRTIKGDHKRFEMTYFSTYKARPPLRPCVLMIVYLPSYWLLTHPRIRSKP